jgi:predicted ATP-grasp superfamily ATP-dependent carboligase
MRVFVYEHLCSQIDADSSLAAEGRAMLGAALADLCALESVHVSTIVAPVLFPTVQTISSRLKVRAAPDGVDRRTFVTVARGCDFALVIAPEPDDVLATRCEWALEAGCRLLGPSPEAVRLCADKLRLAEHLQRPECGGILAPRTILYESNHPPGDGYPYVIKPRSGAGAQATFVVASAEEFSRAGDFARSQGYEGELIAQPYCRGQPGSIAVIMPPPDAPRTPLVLPPAEQVIETTSPSGQLRYAGGSVEYPVRHQVATIHAESLALMIPGLWGYFGIDFVFDRANWSETFVIEINPRLTTSYVGLRRLCNVNLMGVLLGAARGKMPAPPSWREGRVRFDPDGTVYE